MNVRLKYDLEFMAGVYYEDQLRLNSYSLSLDLLTQTDDPANSNVSLERVKYFVYRELSDTVFFGPEDNDKAEMFAVMGTNVTTLPDQPVDQIVAIMLYCKLNAIMESRMIVTALEISSLMGDSVCYYIDEDDNLGPFSESETQTWWHNPNTQHNNLETEPIADNVVKVVPNVWHENGLKWPEDYVESEATIIYPNFNRNEAK